MNDDARIVLIGHLRIKGWHHKACETLSPEGISTYCHCQSNNLLQKILVNNMSEKTKVELPPELRGKKFRIRKLTPRECFRLMGVADSDIDKIQAKEVGISNSAQYKLAGNSIVVDVLFHLFRKMFIETGADKSEEPQQLGLFDL